MKRFIALVLLAGAVAVVCLGAVSLSSRAAADEPNRAGVVVTFGEGQSNALCVEFSEAEISGAELLKRAGFPVITAGGSGGAAVCDIGGTGCQDPNDCFCRCHGSGCEYWAYYTLEGGAWQYSAVGSSLRNVHDGDVDGWAWGSGSIGSGAKPEMRTFDEICPPPAPLTSTAPAVSTQPVEPGTTPAAGVETTPAQGTGAEATPTFFIPGPDATYPPGLAQLAKLPTALASWSEEGRSSGTDFPWEIPVFGVGAIVLLGTALLLAKRRAGG